MTAATLLTTVLLAVSGFPSSSSSPTNPPEIQDASGDANPSAFFVNTQANQSVYRNASAYDIVQVRIALETKTHFLLEFLVRDLPDSGAVPSGAALTSSAPVGFNATNPATNLVANFTLKGSVFEVQATLAMPTPEGLVDAYAIHRDGQSLPLSGSYDVIGNTVSVLVPKALVNDPGYDDKLTKFRAEGRFDRVPLDFAPDATTVQIDPASVLGLNLPYLLLNKVGGFQVVDPQYGRNYSFGQYPGSAIGQVQLSSPENAKFIRAGQTATYSLAVKNAAPATDTVHLSLSSAGLGFAHQASRTTLTLAPGNAQTIQVTVASSSNAGGTQTTTVTAISDLGGQGTMPFATTIISGSGGGSTSSAGGGTPSPGASGIEPSPATHAKKGIPGFDVALLIAALGVVEAGLRRRRS